MSAMGMLDSAFWTSWVLPELLFSAVHAALLCAAAAAFGFALVLRNNFALLLLLVMLAGWALMAFCFALSAFVRK